MRWIVVVLFAVALFTATVAAAAAEPDGVGPPVVAEGKGWCRSC
jgi:hypothetical protein